DLDKTPLILSIDTANMGGSVCLLRGNTLLTTRVGDPSISHSNSLLKDINDSLRGTGVSLNDLDLLAAANGPGSFTGLRIGLATVKALASTLQIPCVGIPTLHAVAYAAGSSPATVALLPAGRGEVFSQLLAVSADGSVTPLDEPAHLPPQQVLEKYLKVEKLKWAGAGAHRYREILQTYAHQQGIDFYDQIKETEVPVRGWVVAQLENNLSQAIAILALQKLENNEVADPLSLTAIYVRPSDAELKCL
ncbi:MAG TPA: tRNA (adenosine(37)-N6)-threonylcarbamoyltransferase complex dimerization subunit type 1 TsaB, partial [Pyrinomonadaceae bacterium]|nr:tRNA (adenosine(37)-N6)-threonylcarbamoyltransferase complex dimerization subunit type 1 TsaB [Pyrinomonadaceae bacterium]